jgi:predicted metal-dependent phosphotriesterase family hydrolase
MLSVVQSVSGPVAIDRLGVVMPHEHTFIDLLREYRANGLINDPELVCAELGRFRDSGGTTLVDLTSRGLHPEPELNRRMATTSGVNVIMGTGFYRSPYLDVDWFEQHSVDDVAEVLAQLDMLEAEGVPAGRVIIGHCDMVPDRAYHRALAERGAWVEFDTIAPGNEYYLERTVQAIHALVDAGYGERILLSHDVCLDTNFEACGGSGYRYILRSFSDRLEASGLAGDQVRRFITDNPTRALSGA